MGLSTDIRALLTGSISNVYIGTLPTTPANAVVIRRSGGYARSLSGSEIEEPTFQVKVRNSSYATGEALCVTINDLLHGSTSSRLLMIEQQGDILCLGKDESNKNYEFTMNYRCYYRR